MTPLINWYIKLYPSSVLRSSIYTFINVPLLPFPVFIPTPPATIFLLPLPLSPYIHCKLYYFILFVPVLQYAVSELGVRSLQVLLLAYTSPNVEEALENSSLPITYSTRCCISKFLSFSLTSVFSMCLLCLCIYVCFTVAKIFSLLRRSAVHYSCSVIQFSVQLLLLTLSGIAIYVTVNITIATITVILITGSSIHLLLQLGYCYC